MDSFEPVSWYVIHTKPRQEERAAENFTAWGLEAFAPQLVRRGAFDNFQPLFPGYIFCRFNYNRMFHKIHFTRGVSSIVAFGGIPAVIEDELIAIIRARLDQNGWVLSFADLQPGDEVTVCSGPLRNFIGVFERELPTHERVEILLKTVTQSIRVQVSRIEVEKLTARIAA